MKILFMGTPEFAVQSLLSLVNSNHEICGVFTREDKPKGRGMKLKPSPVKETALELNVPVFQPKTLKDNAILEILETLNPEIIVVVAYGRILPKYVLDFPKKGCINVHGSLLPLYRGAAPIQWSVINGDKYAGVTTMYMDEGLDTGDMLLKCSTEIGKNETSGELFDRLKIMGADVLVKTLDEIDTIVPKKQNHDNATLAPLLSKTKIDFSKNAQSIKNLIRGLNPSPISYIQIGEDIAKIFSSDVSQDTTKETPGKIICANSIDGFKIACGENSVLEILELSMPNKKRMNSKDFLRGTNIDINKIL